MKHAAARDFAGRFAGMSKQKPCYGFAFAFRVLLCRTYESAVPFVRWLAWIAPFGMELSAWRRGCVEPDGLRCHSTAVNESRASLCRISTTEFGGVC